MERVHAATRCQQCSAKLVITGLEELQKECLSSTRHPEMPTAMGASILGVGRIDESFLILDPSKQPRGGLGGELQLAAPSQRDHLSTESCSECLRGCCGRWIPPFEVTVSFLDLLFSLCSTTSPCDLHTAAHTPASHVDLAVP